MLWSVLCSKVQADISLSRVIMATTWREPCHVIFRTREASNSVGGCHHLWRHKFLFDIFSVYFFVSDLIKIPSREVNNIYCAKVYCFSELLRVRCNCSASNNPQNGGSSIYDWTDVTRRSNEQSRRLTKLDRRLTVCLKQLTRDKSSVLRREPKISEIATTLNNLWPWMTW